MLRRKSIELATRGFPNHAQATEFFEAMYSDAKGEL